MASPSRLLLVEGQDDLHVIRHIRERHGSIPSFCISSKDGIDELLPVIPAEALVSGRKALGVLVDANCDVAARWNAISHNLRKGIPNINFPASPNPSGTVIDIDGMPRIGIWLMPDNQSEGELEDFVTQMIPIEDSVWPLAQGYIDTIPAHDRKFTDKKTSRAKIHAWLAAREDPRQMGLAIKARDLDTDGELCCKFIDWLNKLFL